MNAPRPTNSYSQGYALCTASGSLLGHTYRSTEAGAIEAAFPSSDPASAAAWAERQTLGWTVEHVYAHVFKPFFFVSGAAPDPSDVEEAA